MWKRIVFGLTIGVAFTFSVVSTSAAPPRVKAHTLELPADGALTVKLPAEWRVHVQPVNSRPLAPVASYIATDPVHASVLWGVWNYGKPVGTTLDNERRGHLGDTQSRFAVNGWRDMWGWENGRYRVVGDTFVNLPIGRAWRQTTLVVPSEKQGGWAARRFQRMYIVDRGVMRDATSGVRQQLFSVFQVQCGYTLSHPVNECPTHNGQLAAVMRSIRFIS